MNTLQNFLDWLYTEGKDEKTIKAYQSTVSQFIQWYQDTTGLKDLNFTDIRPIDVKEYLGYMKHTLNRKQATINKTTASMKTFFSYLVDHRMVEDNPMTRIKIQKVAATDKVKGTTKWLTKEEQDRIISYIDLEKNEFQRMRNLAIIDIMLYAGLRVEEVVELKLDDVNLNGDTILTIRDGKYGKYATSTLVNKYSKNLRQWIKLRKTLSKPKHINSPYLFVSERSGKFGARGIQDMLEKYADLANMENITPHRFRHSFCKNLANAGTSIEVIRRLARHESIQTTAIYIDPSHEEQMKALKNM